VAVVDHVRVRHRVAVARHHGAAAADARDPVRRGPRRR
jgi:hypothetical protein